MAGLNVKIGNDGFYRPLTGNMYAGKAKYNMLPASGFGDDFELVAELVGKGHPRILCVNFDRVRFDHKGMVTHCGATERRLIMKNPMPTDKVLGPLCAYIQKNDAYHNKRACHGGVDPTFLAYGLHLCSICVDRIRVNRLFQGESNRDISAALLYSQRPVGSRDIGLLASVSLFSVALTLFAPESAPFLQPVHYQSFRRFQRTALYLVIESPYKLFLGATWAFPSTVEAEIKSLRTHSKAMFVLNGFMKSANVPTLTTWGLATNSGYVFNQGLITTLKALYQSSILVYADPSFYHGSVALQSWLVGMSRVVVVTVGSYARLELGLVTPDIPVYDLETASVDFSAFQTVILYGANLFEPHHWHMIIKVQRKIAIGNPRAIPPLHIGNVFHQLSLVHVLQPWPVSIKIVSSPFLMAIEKKSLADLDSCIVNGVGVDIYDLYCGPASMRGHRTTFGLVLTSWSQLYYLYYFSPRATNVTILSSGTLRAFPQNKTVPEILYT